MKKLSIIFFLLLVAVVAWPQKSKNTKKKKATTQQVKKKTTAAQQAKKKTKPATAKPIVKNAAKEETPPVTLKSIDVTSSFKPELRNANRIGLSASMPANERKIPQLQYNIPALNLSFTYRPALLKPLSLAIDTSFRNINSNYVKVGFGNFTTPYFQAGLSTGNPAKALYNAHIQYTSSKGPLELQQFHKANIDLIGIFNAHKHIAFESKIHFDHNAQYRYGNLHSADAWPHIKDSLRQRFMTVGFEAGLRNKTENTFGINYHPTLQAEIFTDNKNGREINFALKTPISKSITDEIQFGLEFVADLTYYKKQQGNNKISIANNYFAIAPSVQYKTTDFKVTGSVAPAWDNNKLNILPSLFGELSFSENDFALQGGYTTTINKTTYHSLATINPWLQQPDSLKNTKVQELYGGIKGSIANHFTYNAKISHLTLHNQPLFLNSVGHNEMGGYFHVVNEEKIRNLRLHGEVGYFVKETFSVLSGITINQYKKLKTNTTPWGLLPLEFNAAVRWQILKGVTFKSDAWYWNGSDYYDKITSSPKQLKNVVDLNAGVELAVMPRLNIWLQFNNLFNNKYQRWYRYKTLGLNVLGGIVYSFDKN